MRRKGMTQVQLAAALDVNRNTVAAWLNDGTRPRSEELRQDAARALGVEADSLWPPELVDVAPGATSELRALWPRRADVPADIWGRILRSDGREAVDYLAFAGAWVLDVEPAFLRQLVGLASTGTRVRVLLAEPEAQHVALRDAEERLGGTLSLRVAEASQLFSEALHGIDGAEVRHYDAPLYCSLWRAGRWQLVTTHLYGLRGAEAPTLLLERHGSDGAWQRYAEHFERLWLASYA